MRHSLVRTGRVPAALLVVGCVVSLTALAAPAGPAAAAPQNNCAQAEQNVAAVLWAQQLLAVQRAWPFARGGGQTVAVLDSGVDANQPQLRGHVAAGYDATDGSGTANTDCAGTGTQVAGAIAAQQTSASGIYGVAPDVTIVPVRVATPPDASGAAGVTPGSLARGINWAVGQRVGVLDISVALHGDDAGVRAAVAAAVAAGVTVVAAVGDLGSAQDGNPTPYPASYPGVIGVGAIGPDGLRWTNSEHGRYVDLVAPGAAVPAVQRDHGLVNVTGSTALAAGFVSGVAALARSRWTQLSGPQITDRLLNTATPPAGGKGSPEYGRGIVNPSGAVTDDLAGGPPVPVAAFTPGVQSADQLARAAAWKRNRDLAMLLTAIGFGVLLVVTVTAVGLPRARRRAWRATFAPPLRHRAEPHEPGPPALLFEEPAEGGASRT